MIEIRPPISALAAPLAAWADFLPPGWLRNRLAMTTASTPWVVASCAGLAARLAPVQPFEATRSGKQQPLVAEITTWARALHPHALADLGELVSVRCARLDAGLEEIVDAEDSAEWRRSRDEMAAVMWMLEVAGAGAKAALEVAFLDDEARPALGRMPDPTSCPWLDQVAGCDPDAWWAVL